MLRGSPAQPRKWRKRLLLYAAVLALLSLYWPQAQIALRLNRNTAETQRSATAARSSNRSGGYEMIGGAEVVWQRPTKELEGVLFVAHGCNHAATDWLPKSDACPRCTGLPEETNITRTALRRGIAVVAVSSAARRSHRCWDLSKGSRDFQQVKAALGKLLEREGLDGLPLYALGASSGGAFALALASEVELDGVCSQVMAHPAMEHLARAAIDAFGRYPPTAFVLMPRDERTAGAVQANAAALKSKAVPVTVLEVHPARVTAAWLESKVPELREAARQATDGARPAVEVVEVLANAGILGDDGLLASDPRESDWQAALAVLPGLDDVPMAPDASALSEVLNLAYAQHEVSSDGISEILDFFEAAQLRRKGLSRANAGSQ